MIGSWVECAQTDGPAGVGWFEKRLAVAVEALVEGPRCAKLRTWG